jgi:hypothetical protein
MKRQSLMKPEDCLQNLFGFLTPLPAVKTCVIISIPTIPQAK